MLHDKIACRDEQYLRVLSLRAGEVALTASDAPVVLDRDQARHLIRTLATAAGLGIMIYPEGRFKLTMEPRP